MSLFSTAVLFFLVSLLLSPAHACLDAGCEAAVIGLGYAAHVGIAIGVVILVILVVCLIIFNHRKRLQQAQANGTKPYDIEQAPAPALVSELNNSQTTIVPEPASAGPKDFVEDKEYVSIKV